MRLHGYHVISDDEIRKLAIEVIALDRSAYTLFVYLGSTQKTPASVRAYEELFASCVIRLAIAIRIRLDQNYRDDVLPFFSYCPVDIEVEPEGRPSYLIHRVTLRTVCDKVIHAESVERDAEDNSEGAMTTYMGSGKRSERGTWTMRLSVATFAEAVLVWLDDPTSRAHFALDIV